MTQQGDRQLISYIALGAPATRQPATGREPFLRPEFGFTPRWFRQTLVVDFGARWHADLAYRRDSLALMAAEVRRRFGNLPIAGIPADDSAAAIDSVAPPDVLTGVYGGCVVAGIYGLRLLFAPDDWPAAVHRYLADDEADALTPPDLDANPFFASLMAQVDRIASERGRVEGYLNWQGVLNNAYRLRGAAIFVDMLDAPSRALRIFECVTATMIEGAQRLYARQAASGVDVRHFTVSNCMVNMLAPRQYRDLLLPFDRRIAETFGSIGVHNCAWTADPYLDDYATIPNVGYIDMGLESSLARAKSLFPEARRALMYTPMDLANKSLGEIARDLDRIARDYGPCDVVLADVEAGTPDERVREVARVCAGYGGA